MPIITCNICDAKLSVDAMPAQLICPRCLSVIQIAAVQTADVRTPAPVIPVHIEGKHDLFAAKGGLIFVTVIIAGGSIMVVLPKMTTSTFTAVLVITCIVLATFGVLYAAYASAREPSLNDRSNLSRRDARADSNVIDYARATPPSVAGSHATLEIVKFVTGMIAGPTALVVFAMPAGLLVLLVPIGAIALLFMRESRAFGAGMLAGIGLGMLIVISICSGMRI